MRYTFNGRRLVRTRTLVRDTVILKLEKVMNLVEFAPRKMLVYSRNVRNYSCRLLLFDNFSFVRKYEDNVSVGLF